MNMYTDNDLPNKEENLLTLLMYRYLPFWPLFAVLIIAALLGAWGYLHYTTPVYEASATLIIKDENKGVDDSKIMESINVFTSKKIVENEIEVIHSRTLMKQVVDELDLCAPIFEKGQIKSTSAYTSSPVLIKLKDPENLSEGIGVPPKIYFSYDAKSDEVIIDNQHYPAGRWVKTPYGILQFYINSKRNKPATYPLYFSLVHPKKVANDLLSRLEVSAPNKLSTVVTLTFKDLVPQRGEDILNQLIYAYNQAAITDRNILAANTLAFIDNRMKSVENDLDKVEKEVQRYKSTQGVVDLSEQGRLFLQNVGNNDRQIANVNMQLTVLDKVEKYVISKNNKAGIVPSTLGVTDPVLSQLLEKLYNAEIEYEKLSKTTAENNPILASVTNEIEKIRPGILENIRNQRVNLQASLENLNATNGKYNSALQTIPQKERELLEISRRKATINELYSFLLQKREETALSYAPTTGDSRIVDMAESSMIPVSPKPFIVYLIAIIISFASGIAIVLSKEMFNRKILFRSEIEHYIDTPIIGELSNIGKTKGKFLSQKVNHAVIAEQILQLRTSLGLYGRSFSKKKILITSSIAGEGKSFVSINLALNLASSGKKVALLDLDLRNPNVSIHFNFFKQKGITEYLVGDVEPCEIIKNTDYNNLCVVPAGTKIGNNTDILQNGDLEGLFIFLENAFDFVILDTSPFGLVSDAYLLSEYCDISLTIIRHAYTPKSVLERLYQRNKLRPLKNMSIIFNGVKPRGFVRREYGYGYGYGYDYIYKEGIINKKRKMILK